MYILTFLSGILAFLSPCILPMIPIYVSYMAGNSNNKQNTIINAIAFCLGFTFTFTIFGVISALLSTALGSNSYLLNIILGLIVVLYGLNMLGVNIIKLNINIKHINANVNKLNFIKSFVFGVVFSLAHSPCLNAFLGTALILTMSSDLGTTYEGALMLLSFSSGLAIPFLLSAILIGELNSTFSFLKNNMNKIEKISGIFLVIMGILISTGLLTKFALYIS